MTDNLQSHLEQAETLLRLNKPTEAIPVLRKAIATAPDSIAAHYKLTLTLASLGQLGEALKACREGLSHVPDEPHLSGIAAGLLISMQRPAEALPYLYTSLEGAPQVEQHWGQLYRILLVGSLPPGRASPLLCKALEHPMMRPSMISPSIANTLSMNPLISKLSALADQEDLPSGPELAQVLKELGTDKLLLALMAVTPVPSPALERMFTALRRALLLEADTLKLEPEALDFCVALANQAFLSEYAWYVSNEEEEQVAHLVVQSVKPPLSILQLAIVASYRALYTLEGASELTRADLPEAVRPLMRMQLEEPLEELRLRAEISSLTSTTQAQSQAVREQYEENPYPRWIRAERNEQPWPLPVLIQSMGAKPVNDDPGFETPEVLIAGCGTGQQIVLVASRYKDAKILAIDLSTASLAYAARKIRELGIDNVEFLQADILDLGALDRHFHVIESSGVLHHMEDPIAGWRILVDLLKPHGLMNVGLYSELGRQVFVAAHNYIAEHGYQSTIPDIRRCRRELLNLPEKDPLASLWRSSDLYSLSTCRDLLFHVQEHRFTIPQVKQALNDLKLRFLRFDLMDPSGYQRRFPNDPRMVNLDNWHAYEQEQPDTFSGMYQFWAQKL